MCKKVNVNSASQREEARRGWEKLGKDEKLEIVQGLKVFKGHEKREKFLLTALGVSTSSSLARVEEGLLFQFL